MKKLGWTKKLTRLKHSILKLIGYIFLFLISTVSYAVASTCPDPNESELRLGHIPSPWELNPFSENKPFGEPGTQFVQANILVLGMGRGVLCKYHNSMGYYSIWWQGNVKLPSRLDHLWRDTLGGYECTDALEDCVFYPAVPL